MAITTADIVKEYGAYYIDAGQNQKRILTMLSQGREITGFATSVKTDDTIFRLANATFRTLVQPFQKTFTQKGDIEIVPKEIRQYRFKIDDEFMPDELYASWLGFLTSPDVNRKDWPFVKYMVEHYYKKQIDQDMELNEYFNGVYQAPAAGVAGADGTGMNGVHKLLTDGVAANKMKSVDIGPLNAATIFDQVEEFTEVINELYQGIKMNVFMSHKWWRKYMQDKRAQGFYQKTSDREITSQIDFTPLDVSPLASMVGSDIMFCTPKENFIHVSPASLNRNNFKLEEAKRAVAVMADWSEGLGFGIDEIVWTNLQPSGSESESGSETSE